jgi:hypothetical protein
VQRGTIIIEGGIIEGIGMPVGVAPGIGDPIPVIRSIIIPVIASTPSDARRRASFLIPPSSF